MKISILTTALFISTVSTAANPLKRMDEYWKRHNEYLWLTMALENCITDNYNEAISGESLVFKVCQI